MTSNYNQEQAALRREVEQLNIGRRKVPPGATIVKLTKRLFGYIAKNSKKIIPLG